MTILGLLWSWNRVAWSAHVIHKYKIMSSSDTDSEILEIWAGDEPAIQAMGGGTSKSIMQKQILNNNNDDHHRGAQKEAVFDVCLSESSEDDDCSIKGIIFKETKSGKAAKNRFKLDGKPPTMRDIKMVVGKNKGKQLGKTGL